MNDPQTLSACKRLILHLTEQLLKSRKWIMAFLMLLSYVAMITTSSQLTSIAFQQNTNFKAPFLFIFFKMLFRTLAFPMWFFVNTLIKLWKRKRVVLIDTWRHCEDICGPDGVTWSALFWKFSPTALTMLLMQIGYTLGLTYLSTSMTTALYCSAVAISYGLTWVFFKRPLLIIKSVFVLLSFAGVGLIAYANFTVKMNLTKTIIGIIASLLSALFLSFHQISFMKSFPMGDLGQVSFALSGMNILICLVYWPVPLAMFLMGYEVYDIREMPAGIVIASWICTGISSTTAGYGLVLSSPFFMSVGELLILSANSVLDVTVRHLVMSKNQMIGTILIGIAFLFLVIPDAYLSHTCFSSCEDEEALETSKEPPPVDIATVEATSSRKDSFFARRRESAFDDLRRPSTAGRRRSSAFGQAVRRMSQATGELTNAEGQQISYEFYPSSEPCVILSNRKDALPVGLPEARVDLGDGVRRMSVGMRRMSEAAGRRMSLAARRMSNFGDIDEYPSQMRKESGVDGERRKSKAPLKLSILGEGDEDAPAPEAPATCKV